LSVRRISNCLPSRQCAVSFFALTIGKIVGHAPFDIAPFAIKV
jgi:hypothetical protein